MLSAVNEESICVCVLEDRGLQCVERNRFPDESKLTKHAQQWKKCTQLINAWAQVHTHTYTGTHAHTDTHTCIHTVDQPVHITLTLCLCLTQNHIVLYRVLLGDKLIPNLLKQRDILLISKPVERWGEERA